MFGEVKKIIGTGDSYRAIELIESQSDLGEVAERYDELVRKFYWEEKDVQTSVFLARAGIGFCLGVAARAGRSASHIQNEKAEGEGMGEPVEWVPASAETTPKSQKIRAEFLGKAKVLAYNLASFAWDGWDEPGITITECELREGFEAAKLNLRLALELNRPPSGLHNAYWMLGAHYISRGDYEKAIEHFEIKPEGIDKTAELLSDGFAELTKYLKNKQSDREFLEVVEELNEVNTDDSKMFAQQMLTARKVFESKSS